MSRKNIIEPTQIITNGDMSGNIASQSLNTTNLDYALIQTEFTGTPVGTFAVDISNNGGTSWVPLDFGVPPVASGVPGNDIILIEKLGGMIRLRYVATSGSGQLQAWLIAKQAGG